MLNNGTAEKSFILKRIQLILFSTQNHKEFIRGDDKTEIGGAEISISKCLAILFLNATTPKLFKTKQHFMFKAPS